MTMQLAQKDTGSWQYWKGEPRPLNGEGLWELPRNAADLYTWQRLRTFGLYAFDEATVPDGKVIVSRSLVDDAGKPKEVLQLADPSMDTLWAELRAERDRRLTASDPYLAPDRDVDQTAWIAYRQQLRDLPETVTDPSNFAWPEPPAEKGVVT